MSDNSAKKYKKDPADEASDRWLNEQKGLAAKRRPFDMALLISLAAIILVFGVLIFALPSEDFSYEENRVLASFPEFSFESLVSGEFTSGIGEFYADRFPFRNIFVGLKAAAEKLMLKLENNDVIEGEDGYLIERLEYTDGEYATVRDNLLAIEKFIGYVESKGIDSSVVILPRSIDVMRSKLPELYGTERADAIWGVVSDAYPSAIRLDGLLRERAEAGEYVWYKTDHHYTTLGAYYTYVALADELGYEPYPIEYFDLEVISDEFLGTTYSSSGIKWSDTDTFTLFRYAGDGDFTVSYPGSTKKSLDGFYDESFFIGKDKYSAFLGGNRARTSIRLDGGEDRPILMMVKDSFSHSLAPFLALHFDIEMVDLRYYQSSAAKLIDEISPDRVLILYGIDTLATSTEAARIKMGVK